LAKIGEVKVAWSRELPSEPSSVSVIRSPTGKYYASFVVILPDDADRLEPLPDPDATTGIDLGLKDFAVLRGGRVIENPRFFKRLERKLKKAQRGLSRKARGSKNKERARLSVARIHERTKHIRSDWVNKQVKMIVAENQGIFVEDLNVQGLGRGRVAKSVRDASFGMFLSRLESKAARAGRAFEKVDRFFPSTRLCSECAALTGPHGREGLRTRTWRCGCGAVHDRDQNAEVNIRREGQRLLSERLHVAAGPAETRNASGGQVRPGSTGTARNPV
jgi:putative transposase